jgi:hypothetical protein
MTVEADIFSTLKSLVGNRVYPDMAPINAVKPYITYSQVGGEAVTYLGAEVPSIKHGRMQFNVWGESRTSVMSLMLQVESALTIATTFQAKPIGAAESSYDHDMQVYSAMQDFSIWSNR